MKFVKKYIIGEERLFGTGEYCSCVISHKFQSRGADKGCRGMGAYLGGWKGSSLAMLPNQCNL